MSDAASICPECESGVHVACRDDEGTSAECACPCGEASSAASSSGREVSGEGPMISRPDSPAAQGRGSWLARLNQDWITVWEWNPHLYRRVSMSGFVLGFLTAAFIAGAAFVIDWLVSHG